MAASCLSENQNVLYITLEMAEERIAERIDANLMNVALDALKELPKEVYIKKIEKLRSKIKGKLIIKEYPTATASTNNFRALINELKIKKGFVPDIIFIDYINLCTSTRYKNNISAGSYFVVKAIAEEMRGLAVECNVPILSATQLTRQGFCLDINTEVYSKKGKHKIKDLNIDDEVLSNNGWNRVVRIFPKQKKQKFLIKTKSGKTIICSKNHYFPIKEGSKKSIESGLRVGDELIIKHY